MVRFTINEIAKEISESFADLEFIDDTHQYFLEGKELTPVSTVIHKFKPAFDAEKIALNIAGNEERAEALLEKWEKHTEKACKYGSKVHSFAESYFYNRTLVPTDNAERAVVKFYNSLHEKVLPVMCETKVYCQSLGFAGTFDLLCYYYDKAQQRSGLVIYDFKTNKDLYKNFARKCLYKPFDNLLDMPLSIYQLQLSCYQVPLEDLGLDVIARRIVWLKQDGTFECIKMENYTNTLRNVLSRG